MRIYATEEITGKCLLVRIECDAPGCSAAVKPHPEIARSGWTKIGKDSGPGTEKPVWFYCPDHARS